MVRRKDLIVWKVPGLIPSLVLMTFSFLSPKLTSSLDPPAHLHQIDTKKATIQFLTINALSRVSIDLEFRSQTFLSLQKTFLLWFVFQLCCVLPAGTTTKRECNGSKNGVAGAEFD